MKKFFTFLAAALMSVSVFAAKTQTITEMTCAQAKQYTLDNLQAGATGTDSVAVTGYVTYTNGIVSRGQQVFWLDDVKGTTQTFQAYWCTLPEAEALNVGDKVTIKGFLTNYNGTAEMKNGDTEILERVSIKRDTIEAGICDAIAEGETLNDMEITDDFFIVEGVVANVGSQMNQYKQETFSLVCESNEKELKVYNILMKDSIAAAVGDKVSVFGKLQNYHGTIEIISGNAEVLEKGVVQIDTLTVTVAEAIAAGKALEKGTTSGAVYVVVGYNDSIAYKFSESNKNMSFYMCDDLANPSYEFEAYRASAEVDIPVGTKVAVMGNLYHYYKAANGDKPEIDLVEISNGTAKVLNDPITSETVHLATVANYIDFQALSVSDPQMVQSVVTSTNPYTLPNGTVLRGFQKSDGTEAENKWNVKETYNTLMPTPEWEGVDSLLAGTMFRASKGTTIELGAFNLPKESQMVVYFMPNGDSERGISVSINGGEPIEYIRSGVKIDGIRPAYAAPFDLPAGNYDAGDVVITLVNNTSNIFGIGIQDAGYIPEPVNPTVPSDAVLSHYYNQGDVCVCFYVPAEINCNNIVLTGSFNGWKSTAAECAAVEPVEGYDGWYVGSFTPEAEPDAEKGIQAKPIMLDVDGNFSWDYQVGAATVIRGGVQVVQGAYAGEIDLINYSADAPNVFTIDAWKQNPCTAIYHNYTVTVINDGCNGLTIPFIVGDMTNWTFQEMQLDMAKTQEYQTAVYNYSFKATEGTAYQIVSGMMDPQTGKVDSTALPGWTDIAYMQKLVDGQWVRLPGEEYDNQLTHEDANMVWDLRADDLRWARCAPAEPEEYVVLAVNLPVLNCPQAVEIIGSFDDWQGTAMEKLQTGWYFVELDAKASQYFKLRSAGSWDTELEIYDAENDEWKPVQDNQLVFGQLWQDDTYKGTPCKWIELDLSDPEKYRWSVSDDPSVNPGPFAISVTDNSLDDWKNLPSSYVAKAYCPSNASMTALKSVKVFADQTYINILVEPDMSKLPDLEWVPFHVFIDTDNSDKTGGYGDIFTDPNVDIMLETAVFAEGQPYSYNPAVFKWWGEVGGDGWQWIDPSVVHDAGDNWGAIIGEGQLPIGRSQFVNGKIEIQLFRELIPANWNMNEFGIGFDIQQNWSSVGVLPCANATDGNPSGKAAKLKVKVHPSSPLVPIVNREVVIDGIKYHLNGEDTTATVIYKDGGYYDAIIIPAQVSYSELTYKVVAIGNDALYSCRGLTSVTIPNSVTSIGDRAFRYCAGLTSVTIPSSVTSIGYEAFRYCSSLTSLEIPNSVKNCGGNLFGGCTNLNSIIAPADAFVNSWEYPIRLEHIRITAGLMQYDAFYWISSNAYALKTIDLAAVENTELQDNAFNNCYSLQKLVLPANLTRINYMAIAQCIHLDSIAIPAGVTEIGDRAFEDCRSLAKVEFAGTNLQRIGDWAFYNCHELSQINLPEGVTEIGKAAFYGCVYANQAHIPASVQAIGDNAFALCSKLSKMIVEAVVPPTVEDKTFYEVSTTAPVYVPANSVEDYKSHPVWGKLNIIGNAPEGVENVQSDQVQCTKVIENGILYLKYNGTKYNVQGSRVK